MSRVPPHRSESRQGDDFAQERRGAGSSGPEGESPVRSSV